MVVLLGGMRLLIDFVSCIGTLTTYCDLKEVLSIVFGSVDKILTRMCVPFAFCLSNFYGPF